MIAKSTAALMLAAALSLAACPAAHARRGAVSSGDEIRTGIACGQLGDRLIGPQYFTTGMPQSIRGDSGGPVWQISATGAVIVRIWLGEHIDAQGTHYGRFIDLADVADQIGKTYMVV